ncbi:MAG: hypothetical protein AMJ54_09445 [Deltaproteobacteria bacterium SG8_13]|nr:MAG: hypothetical protein AMJ54_09445 [Deltaproteobacteria bacterium SG8_13]
MKKLRAWLAYSLYILVVGALFVYFLFPAEAVSRYIVARVAAVYPDVRISIGDVSPILPPGLKLHRVTIGQTDGDALKAPEVRLYPRWLSLLGKQPAVAYTAVAGQGKIRGTASVAEAASGRQIRLGADLQDVRLEQLEVAQAFADYRLEGSVSGAIACTLGTNRTADAQMNVTDMTVAPPRPVMGIRELHFENVRADATLVNRNVKIIRVALSGEQVSGELTGEVALGRRLKDSTVLLGGTLRLNLRAEGPDATSLPGNPGGGGISLAGRVPVRIEGTVGNPKVSLR